MIGGQRRRSRFQLRRHLRALPRHRATLSNGSVSASTPPSRQRSRSRDRHRSATPFLSTSTTWLFTPSFIGLSSAGLFRINLTVPRGPSVPELVFPPNQPKHQAW